MKKTTKRWLSLALTLVMLLGMVPAFELTARAEESCEVFNTNTGATTYTGEHIKISPSDVGDVDGMFVRNAAPVTISSLNGEIISKIDMTIGWYGGQGRAQYFRSDHGTLSNVDDREGGGFSFIEVNSTSATIKLDANGKVVQIKKVVVYYGVPVSGVTLDKTTATLTVDDTETLIATVSPEDATDKSVTWSSDNTDVATVDNGVVNAVGAGTATITVTTNDGSFTATCEVTVNAPTYTVTFNPNNGMDMPFTKTVVDGEYAEEPEEPIKEGANFLYWYADDEDTPFNFGSTAITSDITLTAAWNVEEGFLWEDMEIEFTDGSDGRYAYTGEPITPAFVVTDGDVIVNPKFYTVDVTPQTEIGEYEIKVTPNSTDEDEITVKWYIYIDIDWSKAVLSIDKPVIKSGSDEFPTVTVTVDNEAVDASNYTVTGDDETATGLYTITVMAGDTTVGTIDYYVYEIGLIPEDVAGSDVKVKYYATRNKDTENILTFGLLLDNKKVHAEDEFADSFDASKYTYNKTATKSSVVKYSITISDTGFGIFVRPYMIIRVNGTDYPVYGELNVTNKLNPPVGEPLTITTTQTVADGKVAFEINRGEPIDGYEFVKMGVLFSRDGQITSLEDAKTQITYENVGNSGIGKGESTRATVKSYTVRVKFVAASDTMYTRGFAIVKNTTTNEETVIYADPIESTKN